MDRSYEGFYARFDTLSKKEGALLMGADNLVGDDYKIDFRTEDGRVVAWIVNKFGADVGFLDVDGSRKLQLANAREKKIRAILSFVAYSDTPDPGMYWGEMALFCYNSAYEDVIGPFIDRIASKMSEGVRPAIDLGSSAVQRIFDEEGWIPSDTVPFPKKEKGMAVLKDHQSISERMIEQGRDHNRGCYAVSIVFLVLLALAIVFAIVRFTGIL